MNQWELTRGQSGLDWKASRHWWVMTWAGGDGHCRVNGRDHYPRGPFFVRDFDSMGMVVVSVPRAAVLFFDKKRGVIADQIDVAVPDLWHLPDEHIWARMPAGAPPPTPNVCWVWDKEPWP